MNLCIVQARMGSTRLSGKIMMKLGDRPSIYHTYNRISKSKLIDNIVIATTTNSSDDILYEYCKEQSIPCFRGSENDVLDRYYSCAKENNAQNSDAIIRITGDCPLIDPIVVDEIIGFHEESKVDYISNTIVPTFPDGLDVEVLSFESLEYAWFHSKLASEREHVTPFIKKNTSLFKVNNYLNKCDWSHYRWTLDEIEDYRMLSCIFEHLYKENEILKTEKIIEFLEHNPQIARINSSIGRDEGYQKSLKKDLLYLE
ncbi:hypothetical protein BHU72_05195 [Desulfuribacillus stibiiarsenatis]|uniref:Acylneuraminate cytidylyltransferase n=1 Tax=Desulfuribacillus stibiiarsenatis TaxID=1390249 RepID=A0A1E5L654_9FIRM|nr:glycosyltransferase family protein [Desulfuribacillus stibiiarsenatis]OEH85483.1 hypothetical protein BHU72_05195 [Desulfuribacillus stibiiarsenatis]